MSFIHYIPFLNFWEFSDHLCAQVDTKQYYGYYNFHGEYTQIPSEILDRRKPVFKEINAFSHQVCNSNKTPNTLKNLEDPHCVAYNFNIITNLVILSHRIDNYKIGISDIKNVFNFLLRLNSVEVVAENLLLIGWFSN